MKMKYSRLGKLAMPLLTLASSMAFADSLIERDLGIDGVKESMLYVAGVGARPARTSRPWAPMR